MIKAIETARGMGGARVFSLGAGLLATMMLVGCDVTNPGPVQDEFLAEPASQQGLVNGAVRNISVNMGNNAYAAALLAREIYPGGQTGAWGNNVAIQGGHVIPGQGPGFTGLHEARFISETAITRFAEAAAPDNMMFQAHLWAGYSYRILGEWWCDAVVGSPDPTVREPGQYEVGTTTYFQRAVTNFTAALDFASTDGERHRALAGRASANLWLGNHAEALADARQVPDDFEFVIQMDPSESALYNDMAEATSGTFRSFTMRFTWFEDYYTQTGDPRTPWGIDPNFDVAVGSLSGFPGGRVPYTRQLKYTGRSDDIRLASGAEMRLVEAEAILAGAAGGDFNAAMDLVNGVRTALSSDIDGAPLEPWTAANATEAWTYLKRERAIELWLEGRRMGDERRWLAASTPGALDTPAWEDPAHPGFTPLFTQNPRSYCFDIPEAERDRNPNVPGLGS